MYAVRYKYLECVRVFAITRYDAHVRRVHIGFGGGATASSGQVGDAVASGPGRLSNFVWFFGVVSFEFRFDIDLIFLFGLAFTAREP
jgi:hypothetical protein